MRAVAVDERTADGRAELKRETRDWEQQAAAIARVLKASLSEL